MASALLPYPLTGLDALSGSVEGILNRQPGVRPGVCIDSDVSWVTEESAHVHHGKVLSFPKKMREIAWGRKVSPEFKRKLLDICDRLGVEPNYLMAAMAFESAGTFSSAVKNKHSGATGLIQFMPSTAKELKTTTNALANLSAVDQLEYVEKYFRRFAHRLHTLEDVYMAILYPVAVGKPNSFVLFERGTIAYKQNAPLDTPEGAKGVDGKITKAEAAAKVRKKLEEGLLQKG